jgi:hypothetical protein
VVPVTAAVLALPGPPSGPLVSTQKLPPRQATTPWLLPAHPITLASPKVPYTVWLPAGPLGLQLYGGAAVAAAAVAAVAAPAASASAAASTKMARNRAESR